MVRLRRLELPRGISPTATSTLRVYQFRHSRTIYKVLMRSARLAVIRHSQQLHHALISHVRAILSSFDFTPIASRRDYVQTGAHQLICSQVISKVR